MTPSFPELIALSAIALLIGIALAKFLRIAMDRYVEIELEDQDWVDNLINKCLSDEFSEA